MNTHFHFAYSILTKTAPVEDWLVNICFDGPDAKGGILPENFGCWILGVAKLSAVMPHRPSRKRG